MAGNYSWKNAKEFDWQVKWINDFDKLRNESKSNLKDALYVMGRKEDRIKQLQVDAEDANNKYVKLVDRVKTRNEIVLDEFGKQRQQMKEVKKENKELHDKNEKLEEKLDEQRVEIEKLESKLTLRDGRITQIMENTSQNEILLDEQRAKIGELESTLTSRDKQIMENTSQNEIESKEQREKMDKLESMLIFCEERITQIIENTSQNEIRLVSDDYVRNIHSYAKTTPYDQHKRYRCINCSFQTNKKSSYNDHTKESCVVKPKRDRACPICHMSFTYRQLRHHLNHFVRNKHKPKNEHANFTPADHEAILEQLKNNK